MFIGFATALVGVILLAFAIVRKQSKRGPTIAIAVGLLVGVAGLFVQPVSSVDDAIDAPTPVVTGI